MAPEVNAKEGSRLVTTAITADPCSRSSCFPQPHSAPDRIQVSTLPDGAGHAERGVSSCPEAFVHLTAESRHLHINSD
ncbi:hypothetical protein [Escherichia coli]|uniref:hypothetical protein n=1 Tax=Escherichia coli TaxID=562 RepID=UPI0039A18B46